MSEVGGRDSGCDLNAVADEPERSQRAVEVASGRGLRPETASMGQFKSPCAGTGRTLPWPYTAASNPVRTSATIADFLADPSLGRKQKPKTPGTLVHPNPELTPAFWSALNPTKRTLLARFGHRPGILTSQIQEYISVPC